MSPIIPLLFLLLLQLSSATALRPLHEWYYNDTCPHAESIVQNVLRQAMCSDPRSAASLMRYPFHDCFVNGCDASMLLDDTREMTGEKMALANIDSLRSFDVIDDMKVALEEKCPGVVSCADIIIMASRDASVLSGGPFWKVKLGRLDSLNASIQLADDIMPSPQTNASELVDLFGRFNLTARELVALSGSHSIGKGRCMNVVQRLYNQSGLGKPDKDMDPKYRRMLNRICPKDGNDTTTVNLDSTSTKFDNLYYKNLVKKMGLFNSDETLYTCDTTKPFVKLYALNKTLFFKDFAAGMIKMADIQSEEPGEIRKNCRVVNAKKH